MPDEKPNHATAVAQFVEQWPIRIERAAELLRAHCRQNKIGRRAGKAIIFSERDFQALYDSLPPPSCAGQNVAVPPVMPSEYQLNRSLQRILARAKAPRGRRGKRNFLKDQGIVVVPLLPKDKPKPE